MQRTHAKKPFDSFAERLKGKKKLKRRLKNFVACKFQRWIILGASQSCERLITVPAFAKIWNVLQARNAKNGRILAYEMKLTRQNTKYLEFYCAIKPQSALKHNTARANMVLMHTVTIKQITQQCFC